MHAAIDSAFGAVGKVHALMSFHDADSDVRRLNNAACARPVPVGRWAFQVLEAAIDLNQRSAGVFDVTVVPILERLGLLPRLFADRWANSTSTATTEAIELLPGDRVRFRHPGLRIDLGGIAKGFAVDRALDVLRAPGMPPGLVTARRRLA